MPGCNGAGKAASVRLHLHVVYISGVPATCCLAEMPDQLNFLRHEPTMQQLALGVLEGSLLLNLRNSLGF